MGTEPSGYNDGSLMKVAKGGGTAVTLAPDLPSPSGIAVDDSSVYSVNGGTVASPAGRVLQMGLSGGTATTLASSKGSPAAFAIDAYWPAHDGNLLEVPLSGGQLVTLASGQFPAYSFGIAVDKNSVYWVGDEYTDVPDGTVMKLAPK